MNKIIQIIITTLIIGNTGICTGQYDLSWKLSESETLAYNFISKIENSEESEFEIDFDAKKLLESYVESEVIDSVEFSLKETTKISQESFNELTKVLTFTRRSTHEIDVKIIHFSNSEESRRKSDELKEKSFYNPEGVKFRGIIDHCGINQSFYLSGNDKLNIALYCTLPNRKVNIGDSWSIDYVPFKANYHFYVENYDKKNRVTLTQIDTLKQGVIATIEYDCEHSIDGLMYKNSKNEKMTDYVSSYKAKGMFNISSGRWIYLKGKYTFSSNGPVTQNTIQTVELIPTEKFEREILKFE